MRTFYHKKRLQIFVFAVGCKAKSSATSPVGCSKIYPRYFSGFEKFGPMGLPDLFLKELLLEFGKVVDWEAPCHQYSLSPLIEDDAPYGSVVN